MPYPLYIQSARGSRVIDVDGNEYVDLTGGFGPLILGHSPEVAVEAAKQAAEESMLTGLPTPYQAELAELIVEAAPNIEKVAFFNSGTEATMYAIRAARAASGKKKVGQLSAATMAHTTLYRSRQIPNRIRSGQPFCPAEQAYCRKRWTR